MLEDVVLNEKKILQIYNPSNLLITKTIISDILNKFEIVYTPRDLSIFQKGLTHKSYVIINNPEIEYEILENCVELQQESNECLEYLGDSIIGAIVSSYLFHRYKKQNEGFLTKLKTKLVRTNMLAKFSSYIDLGRYLLISKHVELFCNGRINERILEDTFEAFIGALFEDIYDDNMDNYGKAMQICSDLIIRIIEETTDFRQLIAFNDNFKELLLQFYHKNWVGVYPIYHEISNEGPTNRRIYTMGIKHPFNNKLIGQGKARKKSIAEQIASEQALIYFEKNPPQNEYEEKSVDININNDILENIQLQDICELNNNKS